MDVRAFFDPATYTVTYLAFDPETRDAVLIDPLLDFDRSTWRISTASADGVREFIGERSLNLRWILETHAHADHMSGMQTFVDHFGAPTAIGSKIIMVQELFGGAFNMPGLKTDGSQWNELVDDGQVLDAGSLSIAAVHTPGHTPACTSYLIGDAVFTGDALFMPDFGTGRCDFPKGSAETLYDSVTQKLYTLPDATRVFVGHDYSPGGREVAWETSIGASKESNILLRANTSRADFVRFRSERDKTLPPPDLILQSLQVNINAGRLPEPEENGHRYLKMPLNFLGS